MNDKELDEMLDSWKSPEAPASLRERVRSRFSSATARETLPSKLIRWSKGCIPSLQTSLIAGAAVGVGAFLFVSAPALPQALKPGSQELKPPFVVRSEYRWYPPDGVPVLNMYSRSYNLDGREIMLSRSIPDSQFMTILVSHIDAVHHAMAKMHPAPPEIAEARQTQTSVYTGCEGATCWTRESWMLGALGHVNNGCTEGPVVGRETILNYPTVAAQHPLSDQKRMTLWMAPALGCFALRVTMEERGQDGKFRLVTEKNASRVTLNP